MSDCPKCLRPLHNCMCGVPDYTEATERNTVLDDMSNLFNAVDAELDYAETDETVHRVIALVSNATLDEVTTYLPKINDELWEMFNNSDLMTWDRENNMPHWTQTAVDFVACIPIDNLKDKDK